MSVVYLTTDLMFSSRVGSVAKSMGVTLNIVGTRDSFRDQIRAGDVSLALIDLEHRDAKIGEIVRELAELEQRPTVIAYAPHVKETLLSAAQLAGCDVVLSRGQFDKQVATLLQSPEPPFGQRAGELPLLKQKPLE